MAGEAGSKGELPILASPLLSNVIFYAAVGRKARRPTPAPGIGQGRTCEPSQASKEAFSESESRGWPTATAIRDSLVTKPLPSVQKEIPISTQDEGALYGYSHFIRSPYPFEFSSRAFCIWRER